MLNNSTRIFVALMPLLGGNNATAVASFNVEQAAYKLPSKTARFESGGAESQDAWTAIANSNSSVPIPGRASVELVSDQADIGGKTAEVLQEGTARLLRLSRLPPGWDHGKGSSLDSNSIRTMNSFFEFANINPKNVGVFMSQRGNVVLNWQGTNGLVEMEFSAIAVELFVEATGHENNYPVSFNSIALIKEELSKA